jgi:hypothetical protein
MAREFICDGCFERTNEWGGSVGIMNDMHNYCRPCWAPTPASDGVLYNPPIAWNLS